MRLVDVGLSPGAGARRCGQRDPGVEAPDAGTEGRGESQERPGEGAGGRSWEAEGGRGARVEEAAAAEEGGGGEPAKVSRYRDLVY